MAKSPAQIAKEVLDLWSRGEFVSADLIDPEIEWVNPASAVEPGTRRGEEGWNTAQRSFSESFESVRFTVDRIEESGERAATAVSLIALGSGSGMEGEWRLGFLFQVRDGRLVRFEWSNDPEEFFPLS